MPDRFQRVCKETGCTNRTATRDGFCQNHTADNFRKRARAAFDKTRKQEPHWRLYGAVWERFKRMLEAHGNVICQKIENGERCRHKVEIYHHLVSPKVDASLMYRPSNVIGLCRQHHPSTEGTPSWVEGKDYVATVWRAPVFR